MLDKYVERINKYLRVLIQKVEVLPLPVNLLIFSIMIINTQVTGDLFCPRLALTLSFLFSSKPLVYVSCPARLSFCLSVHYDESSLTP